jgi:aerobic carbon-monoxide dehydrogenase large subunit
MEKAGRQGWIGRAALRVEDDALLRGAGRFLDDIAFADLLEAAFLRSPRAHGRIRRLELDAARHTEGVHAVLTYQDLRPLGIFLDGTA